MNPKINKVIDDIEKTKTKITELQTLLPELERKRIDMENTEIIRLVRTANIAPADLPAFVRSLKEAKAAAPEQSAVAVPEPHDVVEPLMVEPPIVAEHDTVDGQYSDSIADEGEGAVVEGTVLDDEIITNNEGACTVTDAADDANPYSLQGNGGDEDPESEAWDNSGDYTNLYEEDDADV